jgi:hypothetical protein
MRLIHCTQKMLKELKVTTPIPAPDILPAKGLGNWYANLLRIERRKCILFTNEKTAYSFLVPNVLRRDMENFREFFTANLCANLQYDGFDLRVINSVNQEYSEIGVAKTVNKSILSSMTDIALRMKSHIEHEGGLERTEILRLNQRISKTPIKSIGYRYSIEALEQALGNPPRRLPMPESPDDWLMEIARAYCDALKAKPFGVFVGTEITEKDLYHHAPHICLQCRGISATDENIKKATAMALSSYFANKGKIPSLSDPHVAFALCYLASHFGLGILQAEYVNELMNYIEREAERLGFIIERKCQKAR